MIGERITRLAGYIGLEPASFEAFLGWVVELRRSFSIPHSLADLDAKAKPNVERIAIMAELDASAGGNPRPFDAATAREVLEAALEGLVET